MDLLSSKNYEFKLITPLIMAGAEEKGIEFRTQSIIGILRWWFRFYKACKVENLGKLKEVEEGIWGSQKKAKKFWLKIEKYPFEESDYYAYLRINDRTREIKRLAFKPENNTFSLSFKYFGSFDSQVEVERTFKFLSTFGGLGARWRRGFSSVMWTEALFSGSNLDEIIDEIKKILELNTFRFVNNNDNNFDRFMNLRNTSIYLITPKNKFWNSWTDAMDSLRDKFYRPLKKMLGIKFGRASPLIIQIKKSGENNYFGILLLWEKWEKFNDCEKFIENFTKKSFEVKELKIY